MLVGIDEAGRGPWAGPLVFGAVVLGGAEIDGLDDSKKLTKKRREQLEIEIKVKALSYGIGWVSAKELDDLGMVTACRLACRRALEQINVPYHEIIIDGTINFLSDTGKGKYAKTMPKADSLIPSVSAASILAKVARDNYMTQISNKYPEYGFSSHAGYGTSKHRLAIEKHGVTPEHRLSFAPLKKYQTIDKNNETIAKNKNTINCDTTRSIGDKGEDAAVEFLKRAGHVIIDRNWRTKWCEIDIISKKDENIYFTEVKYRKNDKRGSGLEAITKRKLEQMTFAANMFLQKNHRSESPLLTVIAATGNPAEVVDYLEIT